MSAGVLLGVLLRGRGSLWNGRRNVGGRAEATPPVGRRYGGMEDLIMTNLKVTNAADIFIKAFPE
jgi:hypothetical protein